MTTELDQALLSGSVDDIDKLLEEMNLDDDLGILSGDTGGDTDTGNNEMAVSKEEPTIPEVIDTTKQNGDGNQVDANSGSDTPNNGSVKEIDGQLYVAVDPEQAAIASKDGKHTIPYSVLEKARSTSSDYQSKVAQLQEELGQATTAKQKAELFAKQLEEAGITPDKLPDELLSDPSALESLQDEMPGVAGQVIAALVKRLQQQPAQSEPSTTNEASNVESALQAEEMAELRGWETGDPDRWDMALIIDNKLKDDPAFSAMPLNARFAEVQRRVKTAFGDPVQESIQQELSKTDKGNQANQPPAEQEKQPLGQAPQQNIIPNSPSQLGGSSTDTTQAAHEALANQDPLALEQSLSGMSPEKVEEFLANAVIALD